MKKIKARDFNAVNAHFRKSGPMENKKNKINEEAIEKEMVEEMEQNKKEKKFNFKIIEKNKGSNPNKLPFFCPACSKITGTIDDECLLEYGFCKECYVMYVESRKEPVIDIEYYRELKRKGGR